LFRSRSGSKPASQTQTDDEIARNNAPTSEPQWTASVQSKPTPQQKTNATPPLASDNTENALPIVPAESFVSRWGGL
jgi:hypothetical protein